MKKTFLILIAIMVLPVSFLAQDVAMLKKQQNIKHVTTEVKEVKKKRQAIYMQNMTTEERTLRWNELYELPPSPGFMVYDTDINDCFFYNGKGWKRVVTPVNESNKQNYGYLSSPVYSSSDPVIPNVAMNYVGWKDANVAATVNFNYNVSNSIADRLIVKEKGKYKICFGMMLSGQLKTDITATVHINGVAFEEISITKHSYDQIKTLSCTGKVELNENDYVDIRFKTNSLNRTNIRYEKICLKVFTDKE